VCVRFSKCCVCLQIFFKDGGTTYELQWCRTASYDPFLCGLKVFKECLHNMVNTGCEEALLLHVTHVHIPQQIPTKQSGSWNLNSHTLSHSPNLGPFDYRMFGWLKEALCGQRFVTDDEVKDVVQMWLHSQLKTFFPFRIRRLVNCYTIHVKKWGLYVENNTLCMCDMLYMRKLINSLYFLTLHCLMFADECYIIAPRGVDCNALCNKGLYCFHIQGGMKTISVTYTANSIGWQVHIHFTVVIGRVWSSDSSNKWGSIMQKIMMFGNLMQLRFWCTSVCMHINCN
jgi:hypothetical protein